MVRLTEEGVEFDSFLEMLILSLTIFLIGVWIGSRVAFRYFADPAVLADFDAAVAAVVATAGRLVRSLLLVPGHVN